MNADSAWAVRIPIESASAAGSLRLWPDLLAGVLPDALWLRGDALSNELDLALRKLPGVMRYTLSQDGTLTPRGARIPSGTLPRATDGWRPLATVISPAPQPAALAGSVSRRASLRLERTGREEPASALVTTLAAWHAYASCGPLVRLRRLTFATASDGRVVIRGTPPPPIVGHRCVERDGIAIPCGFAIRPAVDPPTLHTLLGIGPADLALFDESGTWERIGAEQFVAATRAAARATAGNF